VERLTLYFDPTVTHEEMRQVAPRAMESTKRFDATGVRERLLKRGLKLENIVRYAYRPFDLRWLYWEPETKLLDEKRPDYFQHVFEGNVWLEARQKQAMEKFDRGYFVRALADNFGNGLSSFFPLYLSPETALTLENQYSPDDARNNLGPRAAELLAELDSDETVLFYHSLAIMHSACIAPRTAARCDRTGHAFRFRQTMKTWMSRPAWAGCWPPSLTPRLPSRALSVAARARR